MEINRNILSTSHPPGPPGQLLGFQEVEGSQQGRAGTCTE